MLGATISDPLGAESDMPEIAGLSLLPVATIFAPAKQTMRVRGRMLAGAGLFANAQGHEFGGYEIHMGRTDLAAGAAPLAQITTRGEQPAGDADGAVAAGGWVAGTYLHGLFDDDGLRHTILRNLAARKGLDRAVPGAAFDRIAEYDRLAEAVRANIDMDMLYRLIG
jgi:adenosylcobyric acid synthase